MFHFCYKTTNLKDGSFYLGKHSSEDLEDGYLGSGKILSRAIKKHGKENFKREILCFFDSSEEAYEFEEVLVCPRMVADPKCYNIVVGGNGFGAEIDHPAFGKKRSEESKAKQSAAMSGKNNPSHWLGKEFSEGHRAAISSAQIGKKVSEETRRKLSESLRGERHPLFEIRGESNPNWGKKRSEEAIAKQRIAMIGENNPAYGKPRSLESRAKQSASNLARPKMICVHCGKAADPGNFKQHHGDRCKAKIKNPS